MSLIVGKLIGRDEPDAAFSAHTPFFDDLAERDSLLDRLIRVVPTDLIAVAQQVEASSTQTSSRYPGWKQVTSRQD